MVENACFVYTNPQHAKNEKKEKNAGAMSPIYSWAYSILAHLRRKHARNSDISGLALLRIGPQASVSYANGCPFFMPFSLESAVPRQPQLQTAPSHGVNFI